MREELHEKLGHIYQQGQESYTPPIKVFMEKSSLLMPVITGAQMLLTCEKLK